MYKNIAGNLLLVLLLFSQTSSAQPGWRDLTQRFEYTILDENNGPINFRTDSSYSIGIDSMIFHTISIPADSFKRAVTNTVNFTRQIKINDCSYQTALALNNPVIMIIRGKDTMHLGSYKEITLHFEEGYFYFPIWTGEMMNSSLFKTSGNISVINTGQSLFKIPAEMYRQYIHSKQKDYYKIFQPAEDYTVHQLINAGFSTTVTTEDIIFENRLPLFQRQGWYGEVFQTPDSNVAIGMIEYRLDSGNTILYKSLFSILDKKKKTITHWLPRNARELFFTYNLRFDSYNKRFYITTKLRNNAGNPYRYGADDSKFPYKTFQFESGDYGKNWKLSKSWSALFRKYNIEQLEFLDSSHQLAYRRARIKGNHAYETVQGVYYLIRNNKMVDSLKSPDSIHYDNNYNRYGFSRESDHAVKLGPFNIDERRYNLPFNTPRLLKENGKWHFIVTKDSIRNQGKGVTKVPDKRYQNFTLRNQQELVFDNGGRVTINSKIYHLLEKNDDIYIIQQSWMLASFDKGKTWAIHPLGLSKSSAYSFLSIDESGNISFYDLNSFRKYTYRFSKPKPLL